MKIAVLADPHFHDIHRHPAGEAFGPLALRTFADTADSTRVFNESDHALRAALDDIVRRDLRLVVIVGDLTDDGQAATVSNAMAILDDYRDRHGLRFFSTPGNHDLFAIHGRHQSKRLLNADGTHMLVTSDDAEPIGDSIKRIVTPAMFCAGYGAGLPPLASLGFFRSDADLHWECPFGGSDRLEDRIYEIRSADGQTVRSMVDASYLVEPVNDLWLLSLDANVFEPRSGGRDPTAESSYFDSTDAGWNAMLKHKPFVLTWVRDVTRRARSLNKQLLVFSHYPMIDLLSGTLADEIMIFGQTGFARRAPSVAVAEAGIAAGIRVHFSGHLHVNDTERASNARGFLVNVAVPSLVAFPPAYKIAEFVDDALVIETVTMDAVSGHDAAFDWYRAEAARGGIEGDFLDEAVDHGRFLSLHLSEMVRRRYLPREWPADLARLVPLLSLGDVADLAEEQNPLSADDVMERFAGRPARAANDWRVVPFFDLVVDWYRLRNGRGLARPFIAAADLQAYERLCARFAHRAWQASSIQARLAALLRMLDVYMNAAPSGHFAIDLATGDIAALAADHLGRTDRRQIGSASK